MQIFCESGMHDSYVLDYTTLDGRETEGDLQTSSKLMSVHTANT